MTSIKSQELASKAKSILFTAAHHANELTSIQMNLYLLVKTLFKYEAKEVQTMHLLDNFVFYFIPFVNADGY